MSYGVSHLECSPPIPFSLSLFFLSLYSFSPSILSLPLFFLSLSLPLDKISHCLSKKKKETKNWVGGCLAHRFFAVFFFVSFLFSQNDLSRFSFSFLFSCIFFLVSLSCILFLVFLSFFSSDFVGRNKINISSLCPSP